MHFLFPPQGSHIMKDKKVLNISIFNFLGGGPFLLMMKDLQRYQLILLFKDNESTGWFIMIEKKFDLHTRAKIQALSWERCTFSNGILPLWNCAFKNPEEFHVVFKFGGNYDAQIFKIYKLHWKLGIKQKVSIVLRISPQQKIGSLWNFKLKLTRH